MWPFMELPQTVSTQINNKISNDFINMLKFGHHIGKHRVGQDDQDFAPLFPDKREMRVISNFTGAVHDSRENGMFQENRQWPG